MAEMARNDVEIMLDNVGMIYTAADGKNVQAVRGHDHPGHQSPDLSVQDPVRIQCQKAQQVRTACSSHQLDDISRHIAHDQYECEVRNGIFAEFFLKFAHKVVSPFLLITYSFFLYRDCNIHRTISKPHVQKFIEFLFISFFLYTILTTAFCLCSLHYDFFCRIMKKVF